MPPAALLHELGHFLVFWSLGLPGAALHYGSAGFRGSGVFFNAVMKGDLAAAAEIAPVWGVATALSMGLVATYAVVLACCTLCAKWKAHPLLVAMGYLSNLRIFAALIAVALTLGGARVNAVCDECWLERITGIPLAVLALPGVISLVGAAIWLWRYFPRDHRRIAVGAMCSRHRDGVGFLRQLPGALAPPVGFDDRMREFLRRYHRSGGRSDGRSGGRPGGRPDGRSDRRSGGAGPGRSGLVALRFQGGTP